MTNKRDMSLLCAALSFSAAISTYAPHALAAPIHSIILGADNNSAENAFVQPQDPALAGGDRDQSLQFGDLLIGTLQDDLIIGGLGIDGIVGNWGDDVMLGGIEHFNPHNRDRALGGYGYDVFIWKPGDGSDQFWGGPEQDAVVFGVVGEIENDELVFKVSNDQQAGVVGLDAATNLPFVDVTNSPGFCEVIDHSTSAEAKAELDALGLDHLVRFFIRGVADAFEAGEQNTDNGLRVTLHLKDVETVVCTQRFGGQIEVLDLTVTPPQSIDLENLNPRLRERLEAMVL